MPTEAELAQVAAKRKKELLLAEQAARREQAEATLTNLMTGETVPMPGLLPDPVETMRPQTAESLNKMNLQTMLRAAERNTRFGVDRSVDPPRIIGGEEVSAQTMADEPEAIADRQDIPSPAEAEIERQGLLAAQTPTRPHWDSIESIYGPNVRARVGDARADEMEMDRFGPAVTPGAVTRAPTTDARTTAKAELSEDERFFSGVKRKKRILSAAAMFLGTKDNSSRYETSQLAKYKGFANKRALQRVAEGGFPDTKEELAIAIIDAGGDADLLSKVMQWDILPKPGEMVWMHDLDGEKDPIEVKVGSKDYTDAVIDRRVPKSELPAEKSDNVQLVDVYKKGKDGWERVGTYEEADSRRFLDNPNYAVTQIGQITGASGDVLGTGRTERDLSKDVEEISKSSAFLTQTTDLLGDLNNLGSGVVGVTGVVGEAASKIAGQVPLIGEELEDTLAQTFTQTSSKELADFRNKLSLEVPRLIPTYTGEEGKRKTTYEVEITERLSGLKSPTATYTTVKEGLVNVIELNLFQVIRKQIMTNRRISYDVRTDEGILALGNQILKPLGLERTEELELVDRLEDFIEQQLDLNKKRRSDD